MAGEVNLKLYGPWGRVKTLMNNLKPNIKEIATMSQRSIAEKFIRKVKAHLKNQDIPGWTPLTPRYADWKMGKYGAEDILIASGEYYESIKAWRQSGIYFAGVPRDLHYKNGNEVYKVASIHEAWSQTPGKPYRPLWSYTLNEDMGGTKGMKRMLHDLMKRKLREKGYPVTTIRF